MLSSSHTISLPYKLTPFRGPDLCYKGAKDGLTLHLLPPVLNHQESDISKVDSLVTHDMPDMNLPRRKPSDELMDMKTSQLPLRGY